MSTRTSGGEVAPIQAAKGQGGQRSCGLNLVRPVIVAAALFTLALNGVSGQTMKEYIRLGGRVIAIESSNSSGLSVNPASDIAGPGGKSGSFTVSSGTTEPWNIAMDAGLVIAPNPGSCAVSAPAQSVIPVQTGTKSFCYWAAVNATSVARTFNANVVGSGATVTSAVFSIQQDALVLAPGWSTGFGAAAGQLTVTVSSTGGSAPGGWTIDTSSSGLSVVGTTSTSFTLQIPGNTGALARSFAVPVLINGVKIQDLKIKQAGTCSTGVPTSQIVLFGSTATGQLTVPTNSCGDWAAYVGAGSGWLTISSFTTAGDGSGTVNLGATLNKSGSARSATIYINGTAVPVIQGDPVISISAGTPLVSGQVTPVVVYIDGQLAPVNDVSGTNAIVWDNNPAVPGFCPTMPNPQPPSCASDANKPNFIAPSVAGTYTVGGWWLTPPARKRLSTNIQVIAAPLGAAVTLMTILDASTGQPILKGVEGVINGSIRFMGLGRASGTLLVGPNPVNLAQSCAMVIGQNAGIVSIQMLDAQNLLIADQYAQHVLNNLGTDYIWSQSTITNGRCTVTLNGNNGRSSVDYSAAVLGNPTISFNLAVAFDPSMAGKDFLMGAVGGDPYNASTFSPFTVLPASPSGISQFRVPGCANSSTCANGIAVAGEATTFVVSADNAHGVVGNISFVDLTVMGLTSQFSGNSAPFNSCAIRYFPNAPASNNFQMGLDSTNNERAIFGWGVITNSRCQLVRPPTHTVDGTGTSATVTFTVIFKPSFSGSWIVAATEVDNSPVPVAYSSGPVAFTVAAPAPVVVSATPASGTGATIPQISVTFRESAGAAQLQTLWVLFDQSVISPADLSGCLFIYSNGYATPFGLLDSAGAGSITWTAGSAGATLTNNYCTLSNLSATFSGTDITISARVAFIGTAASGTQQIWAGAQNRNQIVATWVKMGTWAVTSDPPGFTLSATAAMAQAGASGSSTVTVTPAGGFNSAVTLAASAWPAGITGTFGTNPATGSSTVTINVGGSVVPGNYTLTVNGTSGSLSASTNFALAVSTSGGAPNSVAPQTNTTSASGVANLNMTWTNPAGLAWGSVVIQDSANPVVTTIGTCYLQVVSNLGSVQLADDAGGLTNGNTFPGETWTTSPSNTHCQLNGLASVPVITGAGSSSVQVTLNLKFAAAWAGKTLTIWMRGMNTAYQPGTWTAAGSVIVSGGGVAPNFTLSGPAVVVPAGSSGVTKVTVNPTGGFNALVALATLNWPAGIIGAFGTSPTTSESWLVINTTTAAVSSSLTVNGTAGTVSGIGTIGLTVTPTGTLPYGVSVTPGAGSGAAGTAQNLQVAWTSPAGQPLLESGYLLIQDSAVTTPTVTGACYMTVVPGGSAKLAGDDGVLDAAANIWVGNSWTISPSNSKCGLNGPGSSLVTVTGGGASESVTLIVTFNSAWAGKTLAVWMQGRNLNNPSYQTGPWQQVGVFKVQ